MNLDIFQWAIFVTFLLGFGFIAFGGKIINDLLASFLTAATCWLLVALRYSYHNQHFETEAFYHHLGDTANIVFFLVFALLIVEIVEAYNGFKGLTRFFKVISSTDNVSMVRKIKIAFGFDKTEIDTNTLYFNRLLFAVSMTSFFLASVIDNVTAALIVLAVVAEIVEDKKQLYFLAFFGGAVAANAGGTFSPIGEITTTQLWAGGQITFLETIKALFLPSLISIIVPLVIYRFTVKDKVVVAKIEKKQNDNKIPLSHTYLVIVTTLVSMLFIVPILKGYFGLPPMIGASIAFCVLWLVISWSQHRLLFNKQLSENEKFIDELLKKLNWKTPLFFLGILVSVSALKEQQILLNSGKFIAELPIAWLLIIIGVALLLLLYFSNGKTIKPFMVLIIALAPAVYFYQDIIRQPLINLIVGFVSSIMDNVALVATVQGMYNTTMQNYESDNFFWMLLSFCAGTGGSMLVVGSAAGVAVRHKLENEYGGNEVIENGETIGLDTWFMKNITYWATINYITGFLICLLLFILK